MSGGGPDQISLDDPAFPLTAVDRQVLATKDEDFHRLTWEDLESIIARNALEQLKRLPSDLWRYLAWSHQTKQNYGSILNFVVLERLRWDNLSPPGQSPQFHHSGALPFENREDYAVLENDWPYGFAPGIRHFIVWTKIPIPVDNDQGDVTPESRQSIEAFIQRFFVDCLDDGKDRVLWFKNWVKLQSVRGVDHVHVLLRDVPQALLDDWSERKDL